MTARRGSQFRPPATVHLAGRTRAGSLEALDLLDGDRLANPEPIRQPSESFLSEGRVDHAVPQIPRTSSSHPRDLRPASRLNRNNADLRLIDSNELHDAVGWRALIGTAGGS